MLLEVSAIKQFILNTLLCRKKKEAKLMYVHKFINHDDVGHEGGDGEWAGKVKVLNTNSDKTLTLLDKLKKESQGLKRSEDEIKSSLSALVNK